MDLMDVLTSMSRGASLWELLGLSLALLSALWGAGLGAAGLARAGWRAGRAALAWARRPSRLTVLEAELADLRALVRSRQVVE